MKRVHFLIIHYVHKFVLMFTTLIYDWLLITNHLIFYHFFKSFRFFVFLLFSYLPAGHKYHLHLARACVCNLVQQRNQVVKTISPDWPLFTNFRGRGVGYSDFAKDTKSEQTLSLFCSECICWSGDLLVERNTNSRGNYEVFSIRIPASRVECWWFFCGILFIALLIMFSSSISLSIDLDFWCWWISKKSSTVFFQIVKSQDDK